MPSIERLQLDLIVNEKGAIVGIKNFNKAVDSTGKKVGKQNVQMKKTGGIMKKLKSGYGLLAGVLTGVVVGGFVKAIKKASEFQEVNAKFKTVFRGVEKEAENMANELTAAYGLSSIEARKFLASTQDLFVPLGLARDEAANLSGEVVKLARDIASFNNLPTADVLRDLQSSMVGNFETTRKYGIVLSEATVKQKIFEETGVKVKGTVDAQTKALTALKLIQEGSADAQGDFARTSDQFANQTRILSAKLTDLTVSIGSKLMPLLAPVVSLFNEWLTSTIDLRLQTVEMAKAQIESATATDKLADRYDELQKKANRTAEENDEFLKISEKLADAMPEVIEGVDKLTGAYEINTKALRELNEQQRQLNKALIVTELDKAEEDLQRLDKEYTALSLTIRETSKEYLRLNKGLEDGTLKAKDTVKVFSQWGVVGRTVKGALTELSDSQKVWREELKKNREEFEKNLQVVETAVALGEEVDRGTQRILDNNKKLTKSEKEKAEAIKLSKEDELKFMEFVSTERELAIKKEEDRYKKIIALKGISDQQLQEAQKTHRQTLDTINKEFDEKEKENRKGVFDFSATEREKALEREKEIFEELIMREDLTAKERTKIREQHINNVRKINEKFNKEERKNANEVEKAFSIAIGNVVADWTSGMADMIVEGNILRRNLGDVVKDLIVQFAKLITQIALVRGAKALLTGGFGIVFKRGGRVPRKETGGEIFGASHSQGGVNINAEGGEFIVRKSSVTPETLPVLHAINRGVSNLAQMSIPVNSRQGGMQEGGVVTNNANNSRNISIGQVNIENSNPRQFFDDMVDIADDMGVNIIRRG